MILNEGMPNRRHHQNGNLFVLFDVKFPDPTYLTPANIDALKRLLPWEKEQPTSQEIKDALPVSVVQVSDRDIRDLEQESRGQDEEDHHHGHGEGVQCAQQ